MAKARKKAGKEGARSKTAKRKIVARDREGQAVQMRLDGWGLQAIADEVGYKDASSARKAIMRGLDRLSPPANIEELRRRELQKLDWIEEEVRVQWSRSCENKESKTVKTKPDGTEVTERVEGQSGNQALIHQFIAVIDRRAKLLGLDAPILTQTQTQVINAPQSVPDVWVTRDESGRLIGPPVVPDQGAESTYSLLLAMDQATLPSAYPEIATA